MMVSKRVAILALGLVWLWAPAAHAGDDVEWQGELGFQSSYHDNYFFRDADGATPEETFLGLYGNAEVTFDTGPVDLTLFGGGSAAWGLDISDTDFQTVNAGMKVKRGATRATLEYSRIFDKVFGEEDDASLFDIDSGEIKLRHRFTDAFSVQTSFEFESWNFGSPDNDRDAKLYEPAAMLRWQIVKWLAMRAGFQWTFKDADAGRFDYDGPGGMVAAEIRPVDPLNLFVRYRARWRDYDGASPGDSNFRRNDTIHDVIANARLEVTDWFGLQAGASFRHGDSDRSDRNYDAFSVNGGFFFTLGSGD